MATYMVVMGSLYASKSVHSDRGAGRWAVIVMIYLFAITFSASWAVTLRVYAPEIQPPRTRASASSLAQSAHCVSIKVLFFFLNLGIQLCADTDLTVCELHRCAHNAGILEHVIIRGIFLLRWLYAVDGCGILLHDAGDQRKVIGDD